MDLLSTPQPHSYLDWEKQELGVQEPILSERRASETESWSPFDFLSKEGNRAPPKWVLKEVYLLPPTLPSSEGEKLVQWIFPFILQLSYTHLCHVFIFRICGEKNTKNINR